MRVSGSAVWPQWGVLGKERFLEGVRGIISHFGAVCSPGKCNIMLLIFHVIFQVIFHEKLKK